MKGLGNIEITESQQRSNTISNADEDFMRNCKEEEKVAVIEEEIKDLELVGVNIDSVSSVSQNVSQNDKDK